MIVLISLKRFIQTTQRCDGVSMAPGWTDAEVEGTMFKRIEDYHLEMGSSLYQGGSLVNKVVVAVLWPHKSHIEPQTVLISGAT